MNHQFVFATFLTCPGKDFWLREGFCLESHSLQCFQSKRGKGTKTKYTHPNSSECLLSARDQFFLHGWHSWNETKVTTVTAIQKPQLDSHKA